jgi:hypothetical protein
MTDILNKFPLADARGVGENIMIRFDVADALNLNSINVFIDGSIIFDGTSFISPFNGPSSLVSTIVDGYSFVIDKTSSYDNFVSIRVKYNLLDFVWSFLIGDSVNTLYFSDGYGAKKIDISELVGESQSAVKTFLDEDSIPSVHNKISSIYGNMIDDVFCLSMAYDHDAYGVFVIKNEVEKEIYSDGYDTFKAQITDDGKMYLINKDKNTIEVYYGVHNRSGMRDPDFIYSNTSIPAIMPGEILTLHVVSGASTKYSGGTRLYVGTENGVTRIEAYDRQSSDGYSAGYDGNGISITYGLPGSGYRYEVLGGTIPRITSISSNEEKKVFFAVSQDGAGNGGITQVSLNSHRKIIYMTQAEGFLPSSDIRDIFGKAV